MRLIQTIDLVPYEDLNIKKFSGTNGLVSAVDLLAYQIGWGKLLIGWYETGVDNGVVLMPGDGFSSWDYKGIASYFYQKYQFIDFEDLKNEFNVVVMRIIEITEHEFVLGRLDQQGVWSWCRLKSGKEWPLSKWIKVNTVAPYKRACASLRKG